MKTFSIVVPVYGNAGSLPDLLARLKGLAGEINGQIEIVFVVDASPDDSYAVLTQLLPTFQLPTQLILHSKNFGSFAAIRTGMKHATGDYIAVMAADMQEPPELVIDFFRALATDEVDITVGRRVARNDPALSKWTSGVFWRLYRRYIFPEMPEGGVDIFACNRAVSDEVLALGESHSSLVGLLYWVGFRRTEIPYERQPREHGKSGWTAVKKIRYLLDSVFNFTDLPLTLLIAVGMLGGIFTLLFGIIVLIAYVTGGITEPGYAPLMLVILFSTFSILVALGIVGLYVWRAFENTKGRPDAIVRTKRDYRERVNR
ncbi:glycosyltransferase family 2 protein [Salinibacterium sp. M195]|uniref:glycosyltransferase family 2 protein n=1 Tax=Salinibacterium sp. M195 TaxID=2583374 RepID=UPI001C62790D|nr:glycosyltransferase family 2 protein [Salinibacterium sp. M195]QYH36005.1 glycosyltransferase family 2 protein [Salinibacterium sp. M195]